MQNRGVRKMKDVVEPVAVRVPDVVGERVTDEDPVPLQIGLAARPLIDAYCKLPRELFLYAELRIKVDQLASIRVDESAPLNGRRGGRIDEDAAWLARGARVFRLPGIYGPGRSALERVASGAAHRVDVPDQVFSRVHVDDIVAGVLAGFDAPSSAYNLSDDRPCDQNSVMEAAARLLGVAPPPFVPLNALSPQARAFYAENRRVANGKARRVLGWMPAYPDFVSGLRALSAIRSPIIATTPPAAASAVQR